MGRWEKEQRESGRAHQYTRNTMATVAGAEAVGVMLAWEGCGKVALGRQGVIQRIWSLQYISPRSWIEEALKSQMQRKPRKLVWDQGEKGS